MIITSEEMMKGPSQVNLLLWKTLKEFIRITISLVIKT